MLPWIDHLGYYIGKSGHKTHNRSVNRRAHAYIAHRANFVVGKKRLLKSPHEFYDAKYENVNFVIVLYSIPVSAVNLISYLIYFQV
jgi:hypothetical protein